jgi:hypothetical protein
MKGQVIEKPGELVAAVRTALENGGPAIFDVRFDPDEVPPLRPRSVLITKEMGLPNPKPGPEVTRAFIAMLKEK